MGEKAWWKTPTGLPLWWDDPSHIPRPLTLRLKRFAGWLIVLFSPVNIILDVADRDWLGLFFAVVVFLMGLSMLGEARHQQMRRTQQQGADQHSTQ